MSKNIKLWEGIKVTMADRSFTVGSPAELWECFRWDIEKDPAAKECSLVITQELFCFGHIDLSAMYGKPLFLSVIPVKEGAEA